VAGFCEKNIERSCFIKLREFVEYLSYYQLLSKERASEFAYLFLLLGALRFPF
jgi:hypothetical protein